MNEYDQTFNPNILIGHNDLISWFSDFALYINAHCVYDHISFTLRVSMTRPLTLTYLLVSVTIFQGSVILPCILALSWYMNTLLSQYE